MKRTAFITAVFMFLAAVFAAAQAAQIGETVAFGSYPQGADGEVMPIEWTVLEIDEEGVCLLLCGRILDVKPYNDEYEETTWRKCSLREWLNGEFFDAAFTDEEKAEILLTTVVNDNNVKYITRGGRDTEDHVFILSLGEIMDCYSITKKQFKNEHEELWCKPTEYAVAQGAVAYKAYGDEATAQYEGNGGWWLRSPGCGKDYAAFVNMEGKVLADGYLVDFALNGVRPAIRVKFE